MQHPRCNRLVDAPSLVAAKAPDAPATWFAGVEMTYGELDAAITTMASSLVRAGVQKGDRIAVVSTPRPEALVALLGVQRAGAIAVGIDATAATPDVAHVLRDAKPVMVLSLARTGARDLAADLSTLLPGIDSVVTAFRLDAGPSLGPLRALDELVTARTRMELPEIDPIDPAAIVHTADGDRRGALLPHVGLAYGANCEADANGLPSPRVLCNRPIDTVDGLVHVCGATLVSGGLIAFSESNDAADAVRLISTLRLTQLRLRADDLTALAHHAAAVQADLTSLRSVTWDGGASDVEVIRTFRKLDVDLRTVHATAETIAGISWSHPGDSDEELATTVGKPNAEARVRVVDDRGIDVPTGETGELTYRHPAQFLGYFGDPDATSRVIAVDGSIRTGDRAVLDADGNLHLLGRRR